jgi:hypothetical protein
MRSWEADEDIAALLELAQKTTGASLKDIVNAAVRIHAPMIIRRLLEERKQAESELISLLDRQFASDPKAPADPSPAGEESGPAADPGGAKQITVPKGKAPKTAATRYRPQRP